MAGDDDYLRGATSINHQVALRANFKMYSRSAKGGEKGDPNRNPWLAKMHYNKLIKSNQVIIIMLYVYMYVVYFVMYDSVLILLLSYGHHDWFNKVFLFLFCSKRQRNY